MQWTSEQLTEWANEPLERATYDPEDDKLRVYSDYVSKELYDAFRKAGFNRAPKQGCFYAVWSPEGEDLALALLGEIEDEDTTVFDRAEDRSARFAQYSANAGKRAEEANDRGAKAVEGIPFGQPILVGHHSERAHRKAIERAQRAADQAVKEYDARDYWKDRARAVKRHAARMQSYVTVVNRIKKLKASIRKAERERTMSRYDLAWVFEEWCRDNLGGRTATAANLTDEERRAWRVHIEGVTERRALRWDRWKEHYAGQLVYWSEFLEENHSERVSLVPTPEVGDWVAIKYIGRPVWAPVKRVNKDANGDVCSVSIDKQRMSDDRYWSRIWKTLELIACLDHEPTEQERLELAGEVLEQQPQVRQPEPVDPEQAEAEARAKALQEVKFVWNGDPDFVPTPHSLVQRMIEAADMGSEPLRILEPSAGDGRIAQAVRDTIPGGLYTIEACEINANAREVLTARGISLVGEDFLAFKVDGVHVYDRILMNPPFSKHQDIDHVRHAYDLLKPGGRLVAIMSESAFFTLDRKAAAFRQWLFDTGAEWPVQLPKDAFVESGTTVQARLVIVDKE